MKTNTHGPFRILTLLAKKARKPTLLAKKVSFVHMSTAYVGSCNPSGTRVMEKLPHVNIDPEVMEKLPHVNIDPEVLIEKLKTMTQEEILAATPGWIGTHQNTYTFSKSLGEILIERHRGNIPVAIVRRSIIVNAIADPSPHLAPPLEQVAIVRPSIIVNAIADPEPGWIENLSGASAVALYASLGRCPVVEAQFDMRLDVIPVDFVTNNTIAAAWELQTVEDKFKIYHPTSSTLNPVTIRQISESVIRFIRIFPSRKAFFRPSMSMATSERQFNIIRIKKLAAWGFKARHESLYFASNEWLYDASNVLGLHSKLSRRDREILPVDPSAVQCRYA
ncbi:male sterility protein-domain-containing protein [Baffinella frigidus]|nr:male sterility protein-domain-containing protein [Cryptophyta sp. CCMP2293]